MKRLFLALLLLAAAALPAAAQNTATITFQRPTTFADGTAIPANFPLQYKVLQGVCAGALTGAFPNKTCAAGVVPNKTLVGTITTTTGQITSGLLSNANYCWQVQSSTTQAGYTDSTALSNEACKDFGPTSPGTVTITVQ